MISVGWCNGLGNYILHSSILRCLASIGDTGTVDLVLDDGWQTETRKAVQLIAEHSPFIRKVVGYPSEYNPNDYEKNYMTFHSIFQSSFFKYLHGDKILERQNYVCWADFLHEQDFYLNEIQKQFGYKGKIYDQYMPISEYFPYDIPQDKKVVCISNGWARSNEGIWQRKEYPHYGELIENILKFYDDTVVYLIGDENDKEWAEKKLSQMTTFWLEGRLFNVCGDLSILETAHLISKSSYGVYNDGALAHVADALKKPGVVLWGSTLVSKNKGLNGTLTNLRSPLLCSPCQSTKFWQDCQTPDCMSNIPVSWIMAVIRKNFLTV